MTNARRETLLDALDQVVAAQTLLIDASTDAQAPWHSATFVAAIACKQPIAIIRHELGLDARAGEGE